MASIQGYNMAYKFNLDALGIAYISIAAVWTSILLIGAIFLIKNRQVHFIRIRNIPLALGSVALLHVYWLLCMLAYVLNGFFPCPTEFWIMSIYLPMGIAMYHASNTQLLHIAGKQKKFTLSYGGICNKAKSAKLRLPWTGRFNYLTTSSSPKKAMIGVAFGMIAQFTLTIIIFMASRKFHPSFGSTGHAEDPAACRRGWEWLPSIMWQFFWAWIYAPYLLWKVRGIKDVHGWRTQTMVCCIAGLPASPMWLMALYINKMTIVRKYFVPPLWFTPSILLMQACVVFVPCFQIYKNRKMQNETRQIMVEWEKKQKDGGSNSSGCSSTRSFCKKSYNSSVASTISSQRAEMYTMATLEKTLHLNSTPLLLFAALKDFSGENISFLKNVSDWKKNWELNVTRAGVFRKSVAAPMTESTLRRQQFNHAVEIYSSFVSLQYSAFPINLSSAHFKELEALFEEPTSLVNEQIPDNAVSPFNSFRSANRVEDVESVTGKTESIVVATDIGDDKHSSQSTDFSVPELRNKLPANMTIPEVFGPITFDKAEQSIKELVLTNTWPKFVNAGFANNTTQDEGLKAYLARKTEYFRQKWTF